MFLCYLDSAITICIHVKFIDMTKIIDCSKFVITFVKLRSTYLCVEFMLLWSFWNFVQSVFVLKHLHSNWVGVNLAENETSTGVTDFHN